MKNMSLKKQRSENISGFMFVLPMFIVFLLCAGIPIVATLFYLAFTKYNLMTPPEWIGLDNFIRMFQDPTAPAILWNTIRYPLMLVPLHVILGLLLALLVNSTKVGVLKYISRTAVYFPFIVTTASVAIAWGYLFNRDFGVINWFLESLGIIDSGIPWTTSSQYAMWSIVIFSGWKFVGNYFLYYLIGLQNIPESYYEAAKIDGANSFQIFRKITLPLLTPSIFYVLLLVMVGAMQAFDEPFFLTKGGPGNSTRTASLFIYQKAFESYEMGYASAFAALLFIAVFILTAIQLGLQKKWVNYDYE